MCRSMANVDLGFEGAFPKVHQLAGTGLPRAWCMAGKPNRKGRAIVLGRLHIDVAAMKIRRSSVGGIGAPSLCTPITTSAALPLITYGLECHAVLRVKCLGLLDYLLADRAEIRRSGCDGEGATEPCTCYVEDVGNDPLDARAASQDDRRRLD